MLRLKPIAGYLNIMIGLYYRAARHLQLEVTSKRIPLSLASPPLDLQGKTRLGLSDNTITLADFPRIALRVFLLP